MQDKIIDNNYMTTGLTPLIYTSKPIHKSNFKYSYELNVLNDPQNLIEEINSMINRIRKLFEK